MSNFVFDVRISHPAVQMVTIVCLTALACAVAHSCAHSMENAATVTAEVRKAEALAKACRCGDAGAP